MKDWKIQHWIIQHQIVQHRNSTASKSATLNSVTSHRADLILHYWYNIALFNLTLDECYAFSFFSINIALLMWQVVLTTTSSCENGFCIFGIALLHYLIFSLFNNCIDCCTFPCYLLLLSYLMLYFKVN